MDDLSKNEPFQIRSHHLVQFLGLGKAVPFQEDGEPIDGQEQKVGAFAQEQVDKRINRLAGDTNGAVIDVFENPLTQPDSKQYAADLIGEDAKGALQFTAGLIQYYKQFLYLPNDYPVRIQSNTPDGVCTSCAIGKHCHLQKFENDQIKSFMSYAKEAGITGLKPQDEGSPTMYLMTDAGTLRRVIQYVLDTKCKNVNPQELGSVWMLRAS